jgi:UDP-N-acetyl-D-mannosaminuronate dehydrogenase
MPRYAFEFLQRRYSPSIKEKNVLLLGVSYRGDVGDTRFSPVEPFYHCLFQAGACISVHDPYVSFWIETGIQPYADFSDALNTQPNIIIISAGHRIYQQEETIESLFYCDSLLVYDTIGLL